MKDIQLTQNPYSWSKTAHIVYIDSPAGTGFSHTPGQRVYHTDDDKTIQDLEVFVAGFFEVYPRLRQQPLIIAGELGPVWFTCVQERFAFGTTTP